MSAFVVYLWHRATGEPFYVGMGSRERAKSGRRNPLADGIRDAMRREGQEDVVTILPCESREQALELEIALIAHYGRIDIGTGCLTNLTSGGQHVHGLSEEAEQRRATARVGKACTEETRQKIRDAMSPEIRERIGSVHRGRKRTPEQCERIRQAQLNRRPLSLEARLNMMSAQHARRKRERSQQS